MMFSLPGRPLGRHPMCSFSKYLVKLPTSGGRPGKLSVSLVVGQVSWASPVSLGHPFFLFLLGGKKKKLTSFLRGWTATEVVELFAQYKHICTKWSFAVSLLCLAHHAVRLWRSPRRWPCGAPNPVQIRWKSHVSFPHSWGRWPSLIRRNRWYMWRWRLSERSKDSEASTFWIRALNV